jgi:hypothetical protein
MSDFGDTAHLEAEIRSGIRKIRNIEISSLDLLPLIQEKAKIPGTTINAFGAILQQKAEEHGMGDWCIFTSLLGPLVMGEVGPKGAQGSVEDHIRAAVTAPLFYSDAQLIAQ